MDDVCQVVHIRRMGEIRPSAPRRRPDIGGYARGEETRARIMAAALRVFAEEGYSRASTRHIAEVAGVTPPALQYYFDSKDGLHRACAHAIAKEIWLALDGAKARMTAAVGREQAIDALCDFLDAMAEVSLGESSAGWKPFIGRAQADGAGPAASIMLEEVSRPLHAAVSRSLAEILEAPADSEDVRLRASAVMAPISAFHTGRANTLAILGWPDYENERLAAIKTMLRSHTRAALGAA
jgi:AcrR family transcriptional regulator